MATKRLSPKELGFIQDFIKTGNATEAAARNYNVRNRTVANTIGSENLAKPRIRQRLEDLGFSEEGAKQVVKELLYDKRVKPVDRISAAREVFKVEGSYAPEKHLHASFSLIELGKNAQELLDAQKEGLQLEAPDEETA